MPSKRLLISARSFGKNDPAHVPTLQDAGFTIYECRETVDMDKSYLEELLPDIETWVVNAYPIDKTLMAKCPNLRLIIKHGIGVDNIDIPAATKRGIIVMNTPKVNPLPVADLSMTLLMCLTRRIVEAYQCVVSGDWKQFLGTGVYGRYLGILGLGQIGLAVADRAAGFGMKILGYDPYAGERIKAQRSDIEVVGFHELLKRADFVSLNLPLSEETRGLMGKDALEQMKPTAMVVNTSRGKIVDEAAMYEALVSKRIAGYATDVFEKEPPTDSPLLALPNVLATPHIGWYTQDHMRSLGDQVIASVFSIYEGESPDTILNPEVLPGVPADFRTGTQDLKWNTKSQDFQGKECRR